MLLYVHQNGLNEEDKQPNVDEAGEQLELSHVTCGVHVGKAAFHQHS
jgi:hypothetical protein